MTVEKSKISRRAVLMSGLGALGCTLGGERPILWGAEAEEQGPPYGLDGFTNYRDFKMNRKRQGLPPDVIKPDPSNPSIQREARACMNCGRCDAACMGQTVAHWFKREDLKPEIKHLCMHCGQCVSACIYNVMTEKLDFPSVFRAIATKTPPRDKVGGAPDSVKPVFVATTAPATRVSVGEMFGLEPGVDLQGELVTALRKLGFDYVFDTTFGADITTTEEARELQERLDAGVKGPLFTSCCPAWVTFVETFYPEFIPNLSTTRSPILAQSAAIKTKFAKDKGLDPNAIVNVAFVPCVGKKFEATRPEHRTAAKFQNSEDGYRDLDYALTTRELGGWLAYAQIDPSKLDKDDYDPTIGTGSGSGKIFGSTGGVMLSAIRQFYRNVVGENPPEEILELQTDALSDRRELTVEIGKYKLRAAVVSGLASARALLDDLKSGKVEYDFVEVMACRGGCISGGGQPKGEEGEPPSDEIRKLRARGLRKIDKNEPVRVASENPEIQTFYKDFVEPGGDDLRETLFHTTYEKRDVWK